MFPPTVSLACDNNELSEGLRAAEGLEMKKVNSKFSARWSGSWVGGKGGELGLPMSDSLSSTSGENHIHAQNPLGQAGLVF